MSGHDLYLVLRERLEAVADTIHIDTQILGEAQKNRGFSNERMARELYISEKTWRRWKAAGAIPTAHLDEVERVLQLDIERPSRPRVVLAEETISRDEELGARIQAVEASQARHEAMLHEILQLLRHGTDEPQAGSAE